MNTPKLRFPEFKGEWERKKLGEVAEKITDGTHDTPKPVKSGMPFLTAIHIKDGFVDYENCYFLEEEIHKTIYKRCNPELDDLLIVNIGAGTATCALNTVEYEFSLKNVALVKPKKTIIQGKFLAQVQRVKSTKILKQLSSGGAQPFLSLKEISKLEITFPTLTEQTRIAAFFTVIDKKISELKQKKALLEQYKKGVMQKLFPSASSGQAPELRFKIENKDGELVEPPDWEKKKLGEVFYSEKGKGISKNKVVEDGKYDCVLYGELYTKYSEVIFEVESKTNELDGIKSEIGDLLIPSSTTTTGIDLANVTALNKKDVLLGGDITVLRSNEKINNIFYAYYLSNHKKEEIASYAQGSTIVHLYYNHIKDMDIDLPCLPEQTKIANFLSALDEKINRTQKQVAQAEVWKKGLLQQMFI